MLIGMLAIAATLTVIVAPTLPSILIRLAGFQPADPNPVTNPSESTFTTIDSINSTDITFLLADHGTLEIPAGIALTINRGVVESGAEALQAVFSAQQMQTLCQHLTDFCSASGSPVRNGQIHIAEGQLLIRGEAYINLLNRWQSAQLKVEFDRNAALVVQNIVLGGVNYSIPDNALGKMIRDWQDKINQALRRLSIGHAGQAFSLAAVDIVTEELVATFH